MRRVAGATSGDPAVFVHPGECRLMYYECTSRCILQDEETIADCETIGGCNQTYWRQWRQRLDECSVDPRCVGAEFVEENLPQYLKQFPCR